MSCANDCFHRTKETAAFDPALGYRQFEEQCCNCGELRTTKDGTPDRVAHGAQLPAPPVVGK